MSTTITKHAGKSKNRSAPVLPLAKMAALDRSRPAVVLVGAGIFAFIKVEAGERGCSRVGIHPADCHRPPGKSDPAGQWSRLPGGHYRSLRSVSM